MSHEHGSTGVRRKTITGLWLRFTSMTTYGSATSNQAILTAQSSAGGETVDGKQMAGATLGQPPASPAAVVWTPP